MIGKAVLLPAGLALLVLAACSTTPMIPTPTGPNGLSIAEQATYVVNGGAVGGADR